MEIPRVVGIPQYTTWFSLARECHFSSYSSKIVCLHWCYLQCFFSFTLLYQTCWGTVVS
jgi:hypothetical protein